MTAVNGKTFIIFSMLLALAWCQEQFTFTNEATEAPTFLRYNSPLRQPGSLNSRPYFDFLSVLYRHDSDKSELFRPYERHRREAVAAPRTFLNNERSKRAILFRPLFVYKQQQVRKQQIQDQRRRRV